MITFWTPRYYAGRGILHTLKFENLEIWQSDRYTWLAWKTQKDLQISCPQEYIFYMEKPALVFKWFEILEIKEHVRVVKGELHPEAKLNTFSELSQNYQHFFEK